MCSLGEHLHIGLVGLVNLTALENLQGYRSILVVGQERTTTGLSYVLYYTAHAHRTVQLLAQIDHQISIFQILDICLTATEVVLHETDNLLEFLMVILTAVEQSQISKGLLLQGNQHTGNNLLVLYCIALQPVGHHIIDVLDEDDISINLVEVLNQGTMTTRTEEQGAIIVPERCVVGIGSHGISTRLLLGEGDVVLDAVLTCQAVFLLCHLPLKETDVLMTHREMHVGFTIAGCIERTFHQVFFHGGTRTFGIFVEQEHTLGQLTVVQAFCFQHRGSNGLVLPIGYQGFHTLTLVLQTGCVQSIIESEFLQIVKILLLEIGSRHIIGCIYKGKHVLEHSAGSTTGRNELHDLLAFCLIGVPGVNHALALLTIWCDNTVSDTGSGFQLQERETGLELLQLRIDLFFRNSLQS